MDAARPPRLIVERLGCVPYAQALDHQHALRAALQAADRPAGSPAGHVICLEHPMVVTLGKRGEMADLRDLGWLEANGVEIHKVDRGGESTFHEPGQLVVYPVVRLDALGIGVVDVVRRLADALARAAATWGIELVYDKEHPGLWTVQDPPRKMASVGMRSSGGVSTHGAAINLTNSLIGFGKIVACGMPDVAMTRLVDHLDGAEREAFTLEVFRERFLVEFAALLGAELVDAGASEFRV
jgi:lipoyl(octanoyl) transferase